MFIFTGNPADGVVNFDNVSYIYVEGSVLNFRMNTGFTMCVDYKTTARAGFMFKYLVSALVAGEKFFDVKLKEAAK